MVLCKSCLEREFESEHTFWRIYISEDLWIWVKCEVFYREDNFFRNVIVLVVIVVVALYYYWMLLHRCFMSGSMRT